MKNLETIKDIKFKDNTMEIIVKSPKAKDIKAINKKLDGKELLKLINSEAKELKVHFRDGGWNINADGIVSDVMYDIFGFHIEEVIRCCLADKAGVNIVYEGKGPMFKSKNGYCPIYYDKYYGEIIIVDNPEDKSYIDTYSESNGYECLGCL